MTLKKMAGRLHAFLKTNFNIAAANRNSCRETTDLAKTKLHQPP